MDTQLNKQIVTQLMAETAKGNPLPFGEAMHEDFVFRPMAASRSGVWGETYAGKDNARFNFFRKWHAQLEGPMRNRPIHIFADGDHVIIESKGEANMKSGEAYNQNYCMVLRMAGGRIMEMREYFDSALADALFEPV
jgi:ketosteroid isomerase-like protein